MEDRATTLVNDLVDVLNDADEYDKLKVLYALDNCLTPGMFHFHVKNDFKTMLHNIHILILRIRDSEKYPENQPFRDQIETLCKVHDDIFGAYLLTIK
jgi:hypothetical protein